MFSTFRNRFMTFMNWLLMARTSDSSTEVALDISPFSAVSSLPMPPSAAFSASELSPNSVPRPEKEPGFSPDSSSAHWAALVKALVKDAEACWTLASTSSS